MKMWVTQCIFLRSSTFHPVNLGKLQFSCLDTRFTKVSTRFVKEVFKLDVDIFHQRQPICKLYSYERATKKENSTISSWDWERYRSEEMAPSSFFGPKKNFQPLFSKSFSVRPEEGREPHKSVSLPLKVLHWICKIVFDEHLDHLLKLPPQSLHLPIYV